MGLLALGCACGPLDPRLRRTQGERSYGLNRALKPRGNRHNPFCFTLPFFFCCSGRRPSLPMACSKLAGCNFFVKMSPYSFTALYQAK